MNKELTAVQQEKNLSRQAAQISQRRYPFEVKQLDQEQGKFAGYATVFGQADRERDIFVAGAFKKFLQSNGRRRVKLLWQHNANYPIGTFSLIKEDDYGLLVTGQLLLDLPKAREAYTLLKSGIVDALSIGFTIKKDCLDQQRKVRLIQEAELWEISLVTFPANSRARIRDVKADNLWQALIQEIEAASASLLHP